MSATPLEPRIVAATDSFTGLLGQSTAPQRTFLESVLDEPRVGMFVVDAERTVIAFNRAAEQITGFAREEVLGRHCLTAFRCSNCLESCGVFARERVDMKDLTIYRSDGSTAHVRKSATVIRSEQGEALGAVEAIYPEGEEIDAIAGTDPATLVWSGIDALMSAIGRAVLVVDGDFNIFKVSMTLSALVGIEERQLVGRPIAELLGTELFGEHSPFRAAVRAGERREGWRAMITGADGAALPVSVTGAPIETELMPGGCGIDGDRFLLVVRPGSTPTAAVDASAPTLFEGMVSRSPVMQRIFALIDHLHDSDATVLITGESGTGKELVARAIHARSTRANQPFVAINCGALPENLLESELFGHARGSFTGAVRDKLGRFEVAGAGTLFLDEIGDLPLPLQVKLLRVLQERTFERVGETTPRSFNARVIAATHHDLVGEVSQRTFREDLFYRLNVVPLGVPPLRERREDLDLLIRHLLDRIGRERSRALRLAPGAMRALVSRRWPGNVRQLENALEYATAICEGQTIHAEDLPAETGATPTAVPPPQASLPEPATPVALTATPIGAYPSAADIERALRESHHRRGAAARRLGISRTTLWRRMKELGMG